MRFSEKLLLQLLYLQNHICKTFVSNFCRLVTCGSVRSEAVTHRLSAYFVSVAPQMTPGILPQPGMQAFPSAKVFRPPLSSLLVKPSTD